MAFWDNWSWEGFTNEAGEVWDGALGSINTGLNGVGSVVDNLGGLAERVGESSNRFMGAGEQVEDAASSIGRAKKKINQQKGGNDNSRTILFVGGACLILMAAFLVTNKGK
ncbi:hypothetical protein C5F63_06030 [Photobacterium damselae subsp. damselae]|uniref:hypothetical protein n=1 Tax=Photobacterium damselae TaxID=38293 RepID=UPI000D054C03|nr:hypothetical protein [Photobacterium damselae]PSB89066.1 hypothetical protein C5F63_06030 [Photobacterium damselae subsp. damselae]